MSDPDPTFETAEVPPIELPALVIPVAPVTDGVPWRDATPVPTPPPSAAPILHVTARLRDLTRSLRRMNQLHGRYLTEVARWSGSVRALRGLAQLMVESHRAHMPEAEHGNVERFARCARELHEAVCAAADPLNPLPRTHGTFVRRQRSTASDILDILRNGEHVDAVRTLHDDASVTDVWKWGYLLTLYQWIGKACLQVERTSMQAQVADEIDLGLTTPDANLIAAARTSLTLSELQDGVPAFALVVKEVNLGLLGIRVRRTFAEIARSPDRCRACARGLVDDFLRFTNLEPERELIEQAVGSGSRADMEAAHARIADDLQGGARLAAGMAVLTYAAGFVVLATRPAADADATETMDWGLNVTGAALDSTEATLTVFARSGVFRTVSRAGLRRALLSVAELAERASSCVTAITAIFEGVQDIRTYLREDDEVVLVVGSLRILSGGAIAAGLLLGIETLNPVGVALGLTAAGISAIHQEREASVPYNKRLCEGILQSTRRHTCGWDRAVLFERLGLQSQMSALAEAGRQNEWWGVRHPPPGSAVDRVAATASFDEAVRVRLGHLGFPSGHIPSILESASYGGPLLRGFDAGD